jgi:hypothetical protein
VTHQCPICLRFFPRLVMDHDHRTGNFRGDICATCNLRIGAWESAHPRNCFKKVSKWLEWLEWADENLDRIREYLARPTGLSFTEVKRARKRNRS